MKIGIITMHGVKNFGSFLQTYATQKMLESLGHDVSVIHYMSANRRFKSLLMHVSSPQWQRNIFTRFIYRLCYAPETIINHLIFEPCMKREFHLTQEFHSNDEIKAAHLELDAYMTGSDKVWSFSCNAGYDPAYYLNFAENDSIRLSYSSSICENKISETESKQIKSDIARYDAISVREYESVDIVKSMGYDNVSVTIDPVLMLSVEEWKVFAAKSKIRLPKKYLLMYMFGREEAPVKIASEYAKQHGLHIVRIGWDFTNRKYCKDVRAFINPYDFVYLFLHANYVVTNSFHGTAFSIKFNKQITILRNAIDPRFSTILKMFGLENRFLPAKDEPKVLEFMNKAQPIDYKKVNSELNKQMEASKSFLTTNLIAKG